jgi:hypothetical protein
MSPHLLVALEGVKLPVASGLFSESAELGAGDLQGVGQENTQADTRGAH